MSLGMLLKDNQAYLCFILLLCVCVYAHTLEIEEKILDTLDKLSLPLADGILNPFKLI